jgi:type IV secretory pathway TraG/TraD family ATPase VirD4
LSRENIAFSRMLCTIVKVLFQQTVLNRDDRYARGELTNNERRVVFFADEYSDVATDLQGSSLGDSNFISLARAYHCMVLLATQNIQMLKTSGLGGVEGAWEGVLGNMSAKIFLSAADPDTAEYASKLLGEAEVASRVLNVTMGGEGVSQTIPLTVEQKKSLQPEVILRAFTRGQGVVIGQLDGVGRPEAHFVAAPYWKEG